MAKFKPIMGPFGSVDEQATTDAFEEYVGGVARAQRMLDIARNSYPHQSFYGKSLSKYEVFSIKAKREGFSQDEIDAFWSLKF